MEFDLEYELVEWEGETRPLTDKSAPVLKEILATDIREFGEKAMSRLLGRKSISRYLGYLWKARLVRKYKAISKSKRPSTLWEIDYEACLQNLSGDPEIRDLLEKRARRQLTIVPQDRASREGVTSHRRTTRGALTTRRTR